MENTDKARIQNLLDEAYSIRGKDIQQSVGLTIEALELSERGNFSELIAASYSRLALFQMIKGNFQQSLELSDKAIQIYERIHDEKGLADSKFNIASVNYKTDNYHLGLLNLIDCLLIYKKFNDHHNIAKVYKALGTIYEYFGDQNNAVKAYEETISHAKLVSDLSIESNAYNPLSGIYLKRGETEKAMEIIEKSIAMKKETGDVRGLAFAIYGRAKVLMAMGNYPEAETEYLESLAIHTKFNELLGLAMTLRKLGELYLLSNQFDKAMETLIQARDFSYKHHIAIIKYKSNYLLYKLYLKLDHSAKALSYLEEFLKQKEILANNQTLTIIDNYELLNKVEAMKRESELQKERTEMLEKKNKAENLAHIKQDFLSTMSHEIRTPLNAVLTIASLLNKQANEEDKKLIHSLQFAANNLMLLINDILDFTKLDAGKVKLELKRNRIKALFYNIHQTYINLSAEKGLKLELKLDPELAEIYELDETCITQLMANLIGNAIKYTDEGSILVEVKLMEKGDLNDQIRFSVIDTGIGISEKDQEEIFNSFSQTSDIRTRKQGGSGLGLAIVKKLIELYHSEIHLISAPGIGSTFYFDLQLKKSEYLIEQIKNSPQLLKGKYILLVEDNPINAMVAEKLLTKWEIHSYHAINGRVAIEQSQKEKYDLILMDIHMPEMDGFEATKWIRSNNNLNTNTPILALTADITAEYNQDYETYFNAFLRKPIELEKLLETLVKFIP